ncbi:MAG: HipA family kinase [Ginsengibacter sp.]
MNHFSPEIRTVNITRYVTPLREGGSLPAITEADDGFMYVVKFRGAGQGVKALIAELIGGEIARIIGLKVPEIVFANLDEAFGRTEPDEEIQDLLKASVGLNLGLHYLSRSATFDPVVTQPDALQASKIVWLDSFIKNVDRTSRNTNMLIWQKELWLIDHGAAFYFHHSWDDWELHAEKPFNYIKDHVLLSTASELAKVDKEIHQKITNEMLESIINLIPDQWLLIDAPFATTDANRQAYAKYLTDRFTHSIQFVKEAQDARKILI